MKKTAQIAAWMLGAVLCAGLVGCGTRKARPRPAGIAAPGTLLDGNGDWRRIATPADRTKLRGWRTAWVGALARAGVGHAAAIDADAALFDPDRALPGPVPPPGGYRCRVFKLGANGTAMRDWTAYPASACRVDADGRGSRLYRVTGAQRPAGTLFADSPSRAVFLGTMMLGDEKRPLAYGQDAGRDMAGYVERIGERRWRLVLPRPRFESMLDVIEIVPAR